MQQGAAPHPHCAVSTHWSGSLKMEWPLKVNFLGGYFLGHDEAHALVAGDTRHEFPKNRYVFGSCLVIDCDIKVCQGSE